MSSSNIVVEWLRSLHLGQYAESFLDNGYDDLEICKQVGDPDLDAIGVFNPGHRNRLLQSVRTLREEGAASVYFTLEESQAIQEECKCETSSAKSSRSGKNSDKERSPPSSNGSAQELPRYLDEYEEGKAELVRIPRIQLKHLIRDRLTQDGIRLSNQPYSTSASQNNRKRPKPNSIISYFKKVEKETDNNNEPRIKRANTCPSHSDPDSHINTVTVCSDDGSIKSVTVNTEKPSTNESQNIPLELGSIGLSCINDIGLFVNKKPDEYTKCQLLERHWVPPKSYEFPHSLHTKNGKEVKRYLGFQHLEQRNWIVFSHIKKGLFCKFCVLFSNEKCGHNKGMLAQNFVTRPLTSFAKLLGKDGFIESHENTSYHKICVQAGLDFLQSYHNPDKSIENRVNSQRLKQVQENKERLRPIIESIVFLGRQNIPLRGHRDDGRLDEEAGPSNEGNFRELLRFKISSGDEILKRHMATASSRATYISNTTQNQLITCCGEEITETILNQVRNARYYSVVFDETTDISHTEQLSLNLRYLHNNKIREDFVKFIDAYENIETISLDQDVHGEQRLSGEALGKIVVNLLLELSLDPHNCVGIGTDSCSVMSSEAVGAVSEIQKVAKHACRCPCLNHILNNSLSSSVNVACIRNSVQLMKSVVSFFNMSAKRNQVLKLKLGHQLTSLCETRWVERHEGVIQFRSGICQIVEALTSISSWKDSKSSSVATTLLNSLCTAEFFTSMLSLIDVLKISLPLSRLLQKPSLDANQASKAVSNTMSTLKERRAKCDDIFNQIFLETSELAEKLDVEVKLPRLAGRQTKRANHPGNIEEYYRRSIYIPLLDNVYTNLSSRLRSSSLKCFGLRGIIPTNLVEAHGEKEDGLLSNLNQGFKQFSPIIGCGDIQTNLIVFEGELALWKNHWEKEKEKNVKLPEDVLDVLDACDSNVFPMIHDLLKILATLPVSVASAERTFSTLRRVKTWLRARMGETRLTGLCLLHVHRHLEVNTDNVIERFAKKGGRRLDFVL